LIRKLSLALLVSELLLTVRMQSTSAWGALKRLRSYSLLRPASLDGTIIATVALTVLLPTTLIDVIGGDTDPAH
jgi:hypothetical protein